VVANDTPRIGAVAVGVVIQDGHVLLEPMAKWLNTGLMWRPIGGYIEFGERAADAVVREFKEELARDVEVVRLLEVRENLAMFETDGGPLQIHEIGFWYELRFAAHDRPTNLEPLASFEQDAPPGTEHSMAHWLPIPELLAGEHPVFPPDLMAVIKPALK
jgi:8-oxo-dGTP pyrophosphatase MutT (NUDIX family)